MSSAAGRQSEWKTNFMCAVVGALAATIVATTAVAVASTSSTSSPSIYACIAKSNGAVRIVPSGTGCGTSATPLNWSVRGLTFWGEYASATAYKVNDVVTYGGSAWVAVAPCRGVFPGSSSDWSVLSAVGQNGQQGDRGGVGPKGENGPAGNVIIQSGYHDPPIHDPLESYQTRMVTMTLQHPGGYIVFAKFNGFDTQNNDDDFTCTLNAGGDTDQVQSGQFPTSPDYRSIDLSVVHYFPAAKGQVVLTCDDWTDNNTGYIRNIKITAISVGYLMNAYSAN